MKVVILAGGLGTRLAEETDHCPKPMVEVGGRPIIWHLMKIFSHAGFNEFIICLGYKGYVIKEYFSNYLLHQSDVTIDLERGSVEIHRDGVEPWKISLVDTGAKSMTGGRLKGVGHMLRDDEPFFFTYGDGLADVELNALVEEHRKFGKLATVTSVRPPGRYGVLSLDDYSTVTRFVEKPEGEMGWINGGFFVLEKQCLGLIGSAETSWEDEPLRHLVEAGQLHAYRHNGFWKAMDTLRDKRQLDDMWNSGDCPWKVW